MGASCFSQPENPQTEIYKFTKQQHCKICWFVEKQNCKICYKINYIPNMVFLVRDHKVIAYHKMNSNNVTSEESKQRIIATYQKFLDECHEKENKEILENYEKRKKENKEIIEQHKQKKKDQEIL